MGCRGQVVGEFGCVAVGDAEILLLEGGGVPYSPRTDRSSAAYARWLPYLRRHPWAFSGVRVRPARFWSYVVRTPLLTLLVDAGVGPAHSGALGGRSGDGAEDLADPLGAAPAGEDLAGEVDVVFVTHSHPLEAGWAFTPEGEPAFPGARYVAQRAESEASSAEKASSLRLLDGLGLLDLVDGEEELARGVAAIPTPGHSRGHQGLLLSSGGEEAFVVGDAFAHPTQLLDPLWSSSQDCDGAEAAWTRMGLLDWLEADGVAMVAGHFPAPGFGRVVRGPDGRRRWQEIEAARVGRGVCAAC
jgi:glyoxylase-like metal-dependent hydrolase (beta-lactamase superfamily II)